MLRGVSTEWNEWAQHDSPVMLLFPRAVTLSEAKCHS